MWLGIVPPVERQDDGWVVSILGNYFLIVITISGTDLSLLDIKINGTTAIAAYCLPISAVKIRSDNSQPGTVLTLVLFGALQSLDLVEVFI